MSIGVSITILGKGIEFYRGGGSGRFTFKLLSITVLGICAEVAIKV